MKKTGLLCCLALILVSCATPRPNHIENICRIFRQYPTWWWAAQASEKKWGTPVNVQMAIIYQESRFNSQAKPPRRKLLWIIPWFRPTSAYGYSQALNMTWKRYKKTTGENGADRDEFDDAIDFIGWYTHLARKKLGIKAYDATHLYLAYHEGMGGFARKTYNRKPWLKKVARKVGRRSWIYRKQLNACRNKLPKKPWYRFW